MHIIPLCALVARDGYRSSQSVRGGVSGEKKLSTIMRYVNMHTRHFFFFPR